MPLTSAATMPFFRSTTVGRSNLNASTCTPNAAASRHSRQSLDERRNAFAGMQPTFRQVPPIRSLSTRATFRPRRPACSAAS